MYRMIEGIHHKDDVFRRLQVLLRGTMSVLSVLAQKLPSDAVQTSSQEPLICCRSSGLQITPSGQNENVRGVLLLQKGNVRKNASSGINSQVS